MLLVKATGKSVSEYMTKKLWQPMGAESSAYWLIDSDQMEMAFGGLNATARDYAKIGELYRLGGQLNGQQIIPAEWVADSTTPDAPYLQPGRDSDSSFGYGYQWWIPAGRGWRILCNRRLQSIRLCQSNRPDRHREVISQ